MKCAGCGHDNPEASKFCTSCGARFGAVTQQMQQQPPPQAAPPQPTTQMPVASVAAPVAGSAYAPVQPPKKSSKKVWIAVVAAAVAVVVIAAAILIPVLIMEANKPIAQVITVGLVRTDGNTLNTSKVPLDTEVAFKTSYKARFKDNGSGTLRMVVVDSGGENIIDKTYDVKSSGEAQSKELKFSMDQGSGKPLHAKATLAVTQGAKKINSAKTMAFTAVEGKAASVLLEEATAAATKKAQEATDTLKATAGKGINVSDLADRLSKALTTLQNAKTADEANGVTATAQGVIDECNQRIAAAAQAAKGRDICRQNQAVVKARLVDWWGGNGNFPNSMSELSNLPVCPDGGTYTYNAPDTTPATLHVSCSVHGEL